MNFNEIQNDLNWNGCKWFFNPVAASHFGAHYERKIGSIRRVLEKSIFLAGPRGLSMDEFQTLLAEASNVVNHTPLYDLTDHPDDPAPLTPHMFLTLRENCRSCDMNNITEEDLLSYGTRRWRRVKYLANQFWKRWRSEGLLDVRRRLKWKRKKTCAKPGDLVLLIQKNIPRNHWPCGRIISVNTSSDSLVRSVEVRIPIAGKNSTKIVTRSISELVMLSPAK